MSDILGSRIAYKPFDHEWAYAAYKQQQKMHWIPEEVTLHKDVNDWNNVLSAGEKNLLTQIFRLFTQSDCDVAQGYFDRYIPLFKKPELRMMLGAFANMEGIHQEAYSLLLDTVGMPEAEYSAFLSYKEMQEKHEYISSLPLAENDPELPEGYYSNEFLESLAENIAVYSAFTEGLQLFGSFAILMNFPRNNKMSGMGTIIEWSIRDESLHVESMTRLFRDFIKQHPWIWTDDFKKKLYNIAREMVRLEDRFIDLAFEQGDIEGLTADEVKTYIRYLCDRRLLQLGLKPNYGVKENPLDWLDWILNGVSHDNFFEKRSTEYAKSSLTGELFT